MVCQYKLTSAKQMVSVKSNQFIYMHEQHWYNIKYIKAIGHDEINATKLNI